MKRATKAVRRALERNGSRTADTPPVGPALQHQLHDLHEQLTALSAQAAETQRRVAELLAEERALVQDRAGLAGIPRARLLATSVALTGTPTARLRVERRRVGAAFARAFDLMAITRCVTEAPDVRALWERLLALEADCGENVLRGVPSTILDVPDATVSLAAGALQVAIGRGTPSSSAPVVAVPRCTYDYPSRKLRNFGHWLLDCAPQVAALAHIAPEATFLLPHPRRSFYESTLSLFDIDPRRLVFWTGSPIECRRALVMESDGRTGGGRPHSLLAEARRVVAPRADDPARRHRRIYVSRRDAPPDRRWLTNEPDVEEVFRSRGFEVVVMAECPLADQVRLFQEAHVVAGVSGAGLADIVFSAPGTHLIVLLSDALVRWYADGRGSRSLWADSSRPVRGELAELGDSPRFYAHVAAAFDQPCHSFVTGDRMPADQLARFLDEVLTVTG